jgi:hypothetical protein
MVGAIKQYVRSNPGCEILCCDDPYTRTIGYCTAPDLEQPRPWYLKLWDRINFKRGTHSKPQEFWEIGLVNLKESVWAEGVPEDVRNLTGEYLKTAQGRENLAKSFTKGEGIWPVTLQ